MNTKQLLNHLKIGASALAVSISVNAFANNEPVGSPNTHQLSCESRKSPSGEPMLGVAYSMTCTTQALAPQYSLRGCKLYKSAVYPNAKPKLIPLTIVSQSAKEAILKSADARVTVKIAKSNFIAFVSFGDSSMKCKPARYHH